MIKWFNVQESFTNNKTPFHILTMKVTNILTIWMVIAGKKSVDTKTDRGFSTSSFHN